MGDSPQNEKIVDTYLSKYLQAATYGDPWTTSEDWKIALPGNIWATAWDESKNNDFGNFLAGRPEFLTEVNFSEFYMTPFVSVTIITIITGTLECHKGAEDHLRPET